MAFETGADNPNQDILDTATEWLGVPFKWAGETKSGVDNSALVQQVYKEVGVELPRVSREQSTYGDEVPDIKDAQPGDIVTFARGGQPPHHSAIYLGDGKILHSPPTGGSVTIEKLQDRVNAIHSIRRVR